MFRSNIHTENWNHQELVLVPFALHQKAHLQYGPRILFHQGMSKGNWLEIVNRQQYSIYNYRQQYSMGNLLKLDVDDRILASYGLNIKMVCS